MFCPPSLLKAFVNAAITPSPFLCLSRCLCLSASVCPSLSGWIKAARGMFGRLAAARWPASLSSSSEAGVTQGAGKMRDTQIRLEDEKKFKQYWNISLITRWQRIHHKQAGMLLKRWYMFAWRLHCIMNSTFHLSVQAGWCLLMVVWVLLHVLLPYPDGHKICYYSRIVC